MICHATPHDYFNMNYACARVLCAHVCVIPWSRTWITLNDNPSMTISVETGALQTVLSRVTECNANPSFHNPDVKLVYDVTWS